ncbi:unnamed protein product [Pedinophyceae sp. YPF-701]|nr:unnamed protein product [Pedinophyceae sp. YPF-701]
MSQQETAPAAQRAAPAAPQEYEPTPTRPWEQRDCLGRFFKLLSLASLVGAAVCAVAFIVGLLSSTSEWSSPRGISRQALRAFSAVLAVGLVLVAGEYRAVLSMAPILNVWVFRGIGQIILGLMTVEIAPPSPATNKALRGGLTIFSSVAGLVLLACGCLHILAGVSCLGVIKSRRDDASRQRARIEREYDALRRREAQLREELAGMGGALSQSADAPNLHAPLAAGARSAPGPGSV